MGGRAQLVDRAGRRARARRWRRGRGASCARPSARRSRRRSRSARTGSTATREAHAAGAQLLDRDAPAGVVADARRRAGSATPSAASRAAVLAPPPPRARGDLRRACRRLRERPGRPRDHVGHQVADDDDGHAASATAILRGELRVAAARARCWPAGSRRRSRAWKCSSRNGVTSRAPDALALGGRERRRRARASCSVGVELLVGGQRVGDHERACRDRARRGRAARRRPARGVSSRHGTGWPESVR